MKLSKTETKLNSPTLSFHGNIHQDNIESHSNRDVHSLSPTFQKETCTNPLSEDQYHIFDRAAYDPNSSLQSLADLTMNLSLSSHSSMQSTTDKMNTSYNSVGLPSDYPIHRKNTSFSSVTVEEELEDFEILFDDEIITKKRPQCYTFSSTSDSTTPESRLPASSPSRDSAARLLKNESTKKLLHHHRRVRTEIGCFDDLVEIAKPSRGHRRRNNRALGAKEFHESVLTELFEEASSNKLRC